MIEAGRPICVAALYKFNPIDDCAKARGPLASLCCARGVKGTLLLAREGINGTIAGSDEAIGQVLDHILRLVGGTNLEVKFSRAEAQPFYRMKVRIKREIVTMGEPNIDPLEDVGRYVAPEAWNELIREPGTILIDTRNDYEVAVGSFSGAINPQHHELPRVPGMVPHRTRAPAGGGHAAENRDVLYGRHPLREGDRFREGGRTR